MKKFTLIMGRRKVSCVTSFSISFQGFPFLLLLSSILFRCIFMTSHMKFCAVPLFVLSIPEKKLCGFIQMSRESFVYRGPLKHLLARPCLTSNTFVSAQKTQGGRGQLLHQSQSFIIRCPNTLGTVVNFDWFIY